jgi:hypothetical protein
VTAPGPKRRSPLPPAPLTGREREILVALTLKCRFMSVEQLARHWWAESRTGERAAQQGVRRLVGAGWLEVRDVTARPELPLQAPVATWSPGDPPPNCGALSYQLQSRWKGKLRAVTVVAATRAAAVRFGGIARGVPLADQATHDLHVAAIYLRLLATDPAAAARWTSEETLRQLRRHRARKHPETAQAERQKLPDAVLMDTAGQMIERVIEFGGFYDTARVLKLHRYCEQQQLPYELW